MLICIVLSIFASRPVSLLPCKTSYTLIICDIYILNQQIKIQVPDDSGHLIPVLCDSLLLSCWNILKQY